MGRKHPFSAGPRSKPMEVAVEGYVPLDSVAPVGEEVRLSGLALFLPTMALVPVHAVLERTVAYVHAGEHGEERRLARRSQIAVRPEDVVHGQMVDPSKPWREWRRYDTREGLVGPGVAA